MSRIRNNREVSADELARLIEDVHQKLDNVLFNGGFETLVKEVQNIERAQREMLDKLEELHKIVYEPDDGLFARVKKVENHHREELSPLRTAVNELTEWKQQMQESDDGFVARTNKDHETIANLWRWKNKMIAVGLSASGATLLMIGKMLWEFVINHVTLH